uniref:Uncharacterized protein n=1 Tax=Rhizophora mucronata TaxID=61149 RepID=A0A2P2ILM4_RHIMU
MKTIIWTHLYK